MGKDLESKIKELEEVKDKLEESKETYEMIVENANDVIFTMDLRGNLLSVNKRSENLTGYTQKELLKINVRQLLDRDSWKVVLKGIKEIIFTKTYNIDELQLRTKNGEILTIDARAALLKIGNKPYTIVGIIRDITERKKYEEDLKAAEEKFRTIFENTNDIIVYVDTTGKVIDVSPSIEKLGYKREEIIGKHFTALGVLSIKEMPNLIKIFKDMVFKGQTKDRTSLNIRDKNGKSISVEVSTRSIKENGQIKGAINIIRDVTERKKYEEELNAKIDALQRYNKISVGREHTMMELKEKIRELEGRLAEKS